MSIKENIRRTFKTLVSDIDNPEKAVNIVETFNKGEWATIYICASRFQPEEDMGIPQEFTQM